MKAVFDTRPTAAYDDDIYRHYHFPSRYLSIVEACVGDWVVLRRPRADGGNLAYFAVARLATVELDPYTPAHYYALLKDFLPFDTVVPWFQNERYAESVLREMPRKEVGIYLRGRSVRHVTEADFGDIISAGLAQSISSVFPGDGGFQLREELSSDYLIIPDERKRRVERILQNRVIREANFRQSVCKAYAHRCAVTGLKVLDRKGNAEAQAAHIWPVALGGPDVVQNGIALSSTVHWLFDRFLISLSEDLKVIVSSKVPEEYREILERRSFKIYVPHDRNEWPHPKFVTKHRERFLELNGAE
jgi:putative restriction endonuclease